MNILFLGDLVGENSFYFLKKNLKNICKKYNICFVIANAENVSGGYGITPEISEEIFNAGVDVISSGNHIWDQKEIIPYIAKNNNLLKPNNFSTEAAGSGYFVEGTIPATDANGTVAGLNLQGDAATADNTGIEMIIGGTQFGGHAACTIGTHAMTFDATFHSVDFTDQDAVTIGFRKIEEFETGHGAVLAAATGDPLYTDFVAFGVQSADDVQIASALNDGDRTYTDTTEATAGTGNHRFVVNVSKTGVVTYEHVGASVFAAGTLAAPTTTAAFTFDDGDVVVPYLVIQNTNQDSAILLKSIKVTRTPGISYVD